MASWVLLHAPWISAGRSRLRFDILAKTLFQSKNHFSVSFRLTQDTPAMEALKKHPYPSAALEASVFEEMSEEYAAAAMESLEFGEAQIPSTSLQTLARLVRSGRHSEAERVRSELLEMGVEIQLDGVYEVMAITALKSPSHTEDQTTSFAHWFMLIPEAHASKPRSFSRIRQLLFFQHKTPDLSLIMQFGLICASKGYAKKVASQVISFVVRFADPAVSARFFDEFEKSATAYSRRFYPREITSMVKTFHGIAIRTHVLAGRLNDAVNMILAVHARKLRVSRFTGQLLLQKLEKDLDTKNVDMVRKLNAYYGDSSDIPKSLTSRMEPVKSPHIASQLKALKQSIISSHPPTAQALVDFIIAYREAGRSRALVMLRKKAFQHNYRAISLWIMAEMLYHYQRKEYEMVLVAFHRNFHLIGVPEKDILLQLNASAEQRSDNAERHKLPSNVVSPQYPMSEKLWPSNFHTALVWNALATLSTESPQLEHLYARFLEFANLSKAQRTSVSTPLTLSATPPPIQSIDEAHFTPFIRAFGRVIGPDRAIRAMKDMVDLGVPANIYHYTTLAGSFARDGEIRKAMDILDRLETGSGLPTPTVVTYTNVLRGFVHAGCIAAALTVKGRLMERAGYVSGSNPQTERVLRLLHMRQQQPAIAQVSSPLAR